MAPLMMKPGRVGVHHTADATCPYTNRDWEGVGGGAQSISPGEGSHCKHSLMIKDSLTPNFQINAQELQNSCCCESFLDLRVSITGRERNDISCTIPKRKSEQVHDRCALVLVFSIFFLLSAFEDLITKKTSF